MPYKDKDARVYAKAKNLRVAAGARAYGDGDKASHYNMLEADANAGVHYSPYGVGADAAAGAHVFKFKDKASKTYVKAFGADIGANAGFDAEAFVKKGRRIGGEVKARGTLVEAKGGPFGLHLGAGVSSGAKLEDGTLDAKLAGCGLKVGKRIGVAVLDNEFSVELMSLFGKGWIWGDFD